LTDFSLQQAINKTQAKKKPLISLETEPDLQILGPGT